MATPEESLENAYTKIRNDLAADIVQLLKTCSPGFFERLVVEVIVKMGYGGSRQDAGKAIGKSGDGRMDHRMLLLATSVWIAHHENPPSA